MAIIDEQNIYSNRGLDNNASNKAFPKKDNPSDAFIDTQSDARRYNESHAKELEAIGAALQGDASGIVSQLSGRINAFFQTIDRITNSGIKSANEQEFRSKTDTTKR